MGNYVTVTPNSGSLQEVLTIGLPVETFGVSVQSLISRECVRRDPGGTP